MYQVIKYLPGWREETQRAPPGCSQVYSEWRTKSHDIKAGREGELCATPEICNTCGNGSFVSLASSLVKRICHQGWPERFLQSLVTSSPGQRRKTALTAPALSSHKEHREDHVFWAERSVSTLHPIKYRVMDPNVWCEGDLFPGYLVTWGLQRYLGISLFPGFPFTDVFLGNNVIN